MTRRTSWVVFLLAIVATLCVLGFYQGNAAAQRPAEKENLFGNAIEQRGEVIAQLKEIKELLKEQNNLLRSGKIQVIVTLPDKPSP